VLRPGPPGLCAAGEATGEGDSIFGGGNFTIVPTIRTPTTRASTRHGRTIGRVAPESHPDPAEFGR